MRCVFSSVLIVSLVSAGFARAESLFSKPSGQSDFSARTQVLDQRAAQQSATVVRIAPAPIYIPGQFDIPGYGGDYQGVYLDMARVAAQKHGIPEDLFLRLVQQESGWNPAAQSHAGAVGLAQLMPDTARRLGVDPLQPGENLDGGARYLRQQFDRFQSWRLALAAYNAGPEAVVRHDGVPPYQETQNYVLAILGS